MNRKLLTAILVFLGTLLLCLPALAGVPVQNEDELISVLSVGEDPTLHDDITLTKSIEITEDNTWLVLNSHTLTLEGQANIVISGKDVEIKDYDDNKGIIIHSGASANDKGLIHIKAGSSMTLINCGITVDDAAAPTIIYNEGNFTLSDDATITGNAAAVIENAGVGKVTIVGKVIATGGERACAIKNSGTGCINVTSNRYGSGSVTSVAQAPMGTIYLTNGRAGANALTMDAGMVENTAYDGQCISNEGAGIVSVTGGTVQSRTCTAISSTAGALVEIGGSALVTSTAHVNNLVFVSAPSGINAEVLRITGGTVTCEGHNVVWGAGGKLTIAGGSIINTAPSGSQFTVVTLKNDARLNITDGIIRAAESSMYGLSLENAAQATMSGGRIIAEDSNNCGVFLEYQSTTSFTLTGGSITASGDNSCGIIAHVGSSFTMEGGTVTATGEGSDALYAYNSSISLRGGTLDGEYAGINVPYAETVIHLDGAGMVLRGGVQASVCSNLILAKTLKTKLGTAYDGSNAALGDLSTADLTTIKYIETVAVKGVVRVEDVTISGIVGQPMDATIKVKLMGDTFAKTLQGAWLTNVPAGVTQTLTRVDDTTATTRLQGTPKEGCTAPLTGIVPASCLTSSTNDAAFTVTDSARWAINAEPPKTGDHTDVALLLLLLLTSALAAVMLGRKGRAKVK